MCAQMVEQAAIAGWTAQVRDTLAPVSLASKRPMPRTFESHVRGVARARPRTRTRRGTRWTRAASR
jgi:hypothetical protein